MAESGGDITLVLQAVEKGESSSERLLPMVYEELRKLAHARMANERVGHTLQATAVVHEAWLRLAGSAEQEWSNRSHFFAAAAEAMRRVLIDRGRKKQAAQHGGGWERIGISELPFLSPEPTFENAVLISWPDYYEGWSLQCSEDMDN